mmetsp:Transcript_1981/g.4896  ORF Transcript_1981/g.4896 Transcript_1981/m.4896 type:complete len:202 (-) Transcript_1981:43-648(-)
MRQRHWPRGAAPPSSNTAHSSSSKALAPRCCSTIFTLAYTWSGLWSGSLSYSKNSRWYSMPLKTKKYQNPWCGRTSGFIMVIVRFRKGSLLLRFPSAFRLALSSARVTSRPPPSPPLSASEAKAALCCWWCSAAPLGGGACRGEIVWQPLSLIAASSVRLFRACSCPVLRHGEEVDRFGRHVRGHEDRLLQDVLGVGAVPG